MGGAPITVYVYRNALLCSYSKPVRTPAVLQRVKEIVETKGAGELENVLYDQKEPWAKSFSADWPAIDTLQVELRMNEEYHEPGKGRSR